MGKQTSIIELNGHKYDALTGKRLSTVPAHSKPKMMDVAPVAKNPHTPHSKTPSTKVHSTLQTSKTLMRHAVKKPAPAKIVSEVKATHPSHKATSHAPRSVITPKKTSFKHVEVQKSPAISRFGQSLARPVHDSTNHDQASHHPVHTPKEPPVIQPAYKPTTAEDLIQKSLNAIKEPQKPLTHKRIKLRHRAAKRLHVSSKVINLASGGLAVLLLSGFFAYQNIPNLAVRYAGMKAGINASLPDYHPSAFQVNKSVKYSPGQIVINYTSNTDDRSYVVTQKKTDWTQSDLEGFMAKESGKSPQTYATENGTIYIQNDNSRVTASTIEDGVLKNISGDSSLNTDQVIKIVSSM